MTSRERFRDMFNGRPLDRPWLVPEGLWTRTEAEWREAGATDEDLRCVEFDGREYVTVQGMTPPFDVEVLSDEGQTVVCRTGSGQICRGWKNGDTHDPGYQVLDSPVKDMQSWEQVKWRLDPEHPDHFGQDWDQCVRRWKACGKPLQLSAGHSLSIFGYSRELMGDEIYYYFYDQPELMHAVMDFLGTRFARLIERVSEHVQLDIVHIWEDMAYKGAPLISPRMFREFMLEPTRHVCDAARRCGVPSIWLDSDGDITQLLPLWLEAGVNTLHPFEVAAGMDVNQVRRQFGDDFWIHGGYDKRVLWHDRDAIDAEFERLRPALERGRYLLGVDHAVSPETSLENFQYYAAQKRQIVAETWSGIQAM